LIKYTGLTVVKPETVERTLSRASLAARNGQYKIINRTVDINVVLALSVTLTFQPAHELWIAFVTEKYYDTWQSIK
jgi:hypothetical protein